MAFDVSALSAYVEENADEFFSRSVLGNKIASMMTRVTGIKSSMLLPTLDHSYDLLQADANCNFVDGACQFAAGPKSAGIPCQVTGCARRDGRNDEVPKWQDWGTPAFCGCRE